MVQMKFQKHLSVYQAMRHLDYWVKRFDQFEVKHTGIQEQFGKKVLIICRF